MLVIAALFFVAVPPVLVEAEGILEGISGDVEGRYSYISTKTTDASGGTQKSTFNNYGGRARLNLNFDLFPTLNVKAGGIWETATTDPTGDTAGGTAEVNRLRPYLWLTLRDSVYNAAVGYDRTEVTTKASGFPSLTLNQENYNTNFHWKPTALPSLHLQLRRTSTYDDARSLQDLQEDYMLLKPQYVYKGLEVYYQGTYLKDTNKILNFESTQWAHEGRLIYSGNFLDGRISVSTDDRLRYTDIQTQSVGQGQVSLPVLPFAGLFALDDTPFTGALANNPAVIDGNQTTSIGADGSLLVPAAPLVPRNAGIDFLTVVELNNLLVWVNVTDAGGTVVNLPQAIADLFFWEIYTSTDNFNWTLHASAAPALYGPFLTRFELNFPTVQTRYIKVVVRPLLSTTLPPTTVNQIAVAEIQPFLNRTAQDVTRGTSLIFQNYNLNAKALLLRSPSLYYNFNGYYYETSPDGRQQHNISNGLFFNHRFTPILSSNANVAVEYGSQGDETQTSFLYNGSVTATPLRTLTNSLAFNGAYRFIENRTSNDTSVILYNNAQLYKGIDASLNLGAVFRSEELETGRTLSRRDLYVNVGTGLTPRPDLTMALYYLGKISHETGGFGGGSEDTTENRLDFSASWSPFRTLFLSAAVNAVFQSGKDVQVQQNYGVSWSPFPEGDLRLGLFYSENYLPDRFWSIQPTLRWYFRSRRASYLDVTYQFTDNESGSQRTETSAITTTLKIVF